MHLAHVFLVSYYKWKIHNYLFQQKTFICIAKSLIVWKLDQELLLNPKSSCMGWAMIGTEL